jgi:hypothetical protein
VVVGQDVYTVCALRSATGTTASQPTFAMSGVHFTSDRRPQFLGQPQTCVTLLKLVEAEILTYRTSSIFNRPLIVRHDERPAPAIVMVD